jgi:hypothetical protein
MSLLLSISLPTKVQIEIYSAKIVRDAKFYIKILNESPISIRLNYSDEEEIFSVENICLLLESTEDSITSFRELYGEQFNSTKFRLFDLIEDAYSSQYGFSIENSPCFVKYKELKRKIEIVEKTMADMWRKFDEYKRREIAGMNMSLEDCNILVFENPIKNENDIIMKLEEVLRNYKKVSCKTSESVSTSSNISTPVKESSKSDPLTIRKNRFGQFVWDKYNFVFDPRSKCIIGSTTSDGGVSPLSRQDVDTCKRMGVKYKENE